VAEEALFWLHVSLPVPVVVATLVAAPVLPRTRWTETSPVGASSVLLHDAGALCSQPQPPMLPSSRLKELILGVRAMLCSTGI
jgi:hypothetical protein